MDEAAETRRFSPRPEGGRPGRGAGVLHAQRGPSAGRLLAVALPGRASSGVSSYTDRDHFRSEATLMPSCHLTCLLSLLLPLGELGLRRERGGGAAQPPASVSTALHVQEQLRAGRQRERAGPPCAGPEGCPLRAGFCFRAGGSQRGFRTTLAAVIQGDVSPWRRGLHLPRGCRENTRPGHRDLTRASGAER